MPDRLSEREEFASRIMAALVQRSQFENVFILIDKERLCKNAVVLADALIVELWKTPSPVHPNPPPLPDFVPMHKDQE